MSEYINIFEKYQDKNITYVIEKAVVPDWNKYDIRITKRTEHYEVTGFGHFSEYGIHYNGKTFLPYTMDHNERMSSKDGKWVERDDRMEKIVEEFSLLMESGKFNEEAQEVFQEFKHKYVNNIEKR